MFAHTPSDRVQLRGRGELMHPGSCALCGSGNCDDGYVDLDIFYEYEGQVYLCMVCANQVVGVAGGLPSDEANFLKAQFEDTASRLKAAESELHELRAKLGSWDSIFSGAFGSSFSDLERELKEAQRESVNADSSLSGDGESKPSESGEGAGSSVTVRVKRGNPRSNASSVEL